jgi:hypothetical protein
MRMKTMAIVQVAFQIYLAPYCMLATQLPGAHPTTADRVSTPELTPSSEPLLRRTDDTQHSSIKIKSSKGGRRASPRNNQAGQVIER